MASKTALKRILNKDLKEIESKNLNSLGIYIHFDEENLMRAKAMIVGPKGTLYEGGFLFFNISFPNNYPFSPPTISYVSRNNVRIHPNIYVGGNTNGGKVCLSILGTWNGPKWTSIMDITTILLTIQSLLDNNPLHHEPGQENNNTSINHLYNQVIEYESIYTLLLKNFLDIPNGFECFLDRMKDIIKENKSAILQRIEKIKYEKNRSIQVSFYRISIYVDYQKLYKDSIELLKEY